MKGMVLPYMRPQGPQSFITDDYVSSPPALVIVDESGAVWTLGLSMERKQSGVGGLCPNGEFAFNVLRNGVDTGEVASRIERRAGRIRIFTVSGWKRWNGRTFI